MKTFRRVVPDPPRLGSEKEPTGAAGHERRVGNLLFLVGGFLVVVWLWAMAMIFPEMKLSVLSYQWEPQIVKISQSESTYRNGRGHVDVEFQIFVESEPVEKKKRFFTRGDEDEFRVWGGDYAAGRELSLLVSPEGEIMTKRWDGVGLTLTFMMVLAYALMAFKAGRLRWRRATELEEIKGD